MGIIETLERIVSEIQNLEVSESDHPAWKKFIVEQIKFWIVDLKIDKEKKTGSK